MEYIIALFAVIANMGADRLRGTGATTIIKCDWYGAVMFALFMAFMFPMLWWQVALVMFLYKVGETSGWGEPIGSFFVGREMGPTYDRYQFLPILRKSIPVALLFRGAMWGAPLAAVLYFIDPILAAITFASFTVFFYLSCIATEKWYPNETARDQWSIMEEVRGGMTMLPIAIYSIM